MFSVLLSLAVGVPTPSPTISPLAPPVVQWYAQRGADASGLDPELVRAVIDAESGGDPKAVSKAGAIGMMQLAAATASDCGIRDLFDPLANVQCGSRTLGYLVRNYGMEGGIAAYNFGAGDVEAAGGHLGKMPVETQQYVKAVIEEYDDLQHESLDARAPDFETLIMRAPVPPPVDGFAAEILGLVPHPPEESNVSIERLIEGLHAPRARRLDLQIERTWLVYEDRRARPSLVSLDRSHVDR